MQLVFINLVSSLKAFCRWNEAVHYSACKRCSGNFFEGPAAVNLENGDSCSEKMIGSLFSVFTESTGLWWKIFNYKGLYFSGIYFISNYRELPWWLARNHQKPKFFAALPYCPWRPKFFAHLKISSEFASFNCFDCFKEQASFQIPRKSWLYQWLILSRILWSLFCLSSPPLLLARKMHLDNLNNFPQFSSVWGSSMQSVMTSEKSSDFCTIHW